MGYQQLAKITENVDFLRDETVQCRHFLILVFVRNHLTDETSNQLTR